MIAKTMRHDRLRKLNCILLLGFVCGCTGDDLVRSDSPQVLETSGHFKTSLENLRFVIYYDDKTVVELSNPHKVKYVDFNVPIPAFSSVVESRNDKYTLYLFDDNAISSAHLSELTIFPSGDGGYIGFYGLLDIHKRFSDENEMIVVGLAYSDTNGNENVLTDDEAFKSPFSEFVNERIDAIEMKLGIVKTTSSLIYKSDSVDHDLVIIQGLTKDNVELLGIFTFKNEKFTQVTFNRGLLTHRGALILADPMGEKDYTPVSSGVTFLPDIDSNGYPEIAISAIASFLFDIQQDDSGEVSMTRIKTIYFGP